MSAVTGTPGDPEDDALVASTQARLFAALRELRRPASTQELGALVGRHPNTVRVALTRMADSGLVERRLVHQPRGRPRHTWAIGARARPGGARPDAPADLGRWLARAMRSGHTLDDVEATGRQIGRELAPAPGPGAGAVRQVMQDALTALGFAPRDDETADGGLRYVLGNCPYGAAVAENQAVVCTLHRGITRGLLDRVDPGRELRAFVPRDPATAGCLVELAPRTA